jgi:hypothetical protein
VWIEFLIVWIMLGVIFFKCVKYRINFIRMIFWIQDQVTMIFLLAVNILASFSKHGHENLKKVKLKLCTHYFISRYYLKVKRYWPLHFCTSSPLGNISFIFTDIYRITAVMKVETDITTSITASLIEQDLQNWHYCFYG